MSVDVLLAFAVFAFVSAATPGPNNLLILGSGLRVGLWRTMPFVVGINFGFSVLLVSVSYGLGTMFERFPAAHLSLKVIGTGYFLYLAASLLRGGKAKREAEREDLGFWSGAVFQVVNPKAWLMCITAVALFLPVGWSPATIMLMVITFVLLGLPSNVAWAGIGQSLRKLVSDERRMRVFNLVMAVLLVLSIIPVWIS
ncbi:LysE family translocator [uncultured Marivita sp.]|uniref:LysE family translocator n=1 Tax=uncultured Marivita sp. TaxID=888080 RepID=UPI00261CFFC0|nr:LysE family translocator [uncultured Marivita sp.]